MDELYGQSRRDKWTVPVARAASREEEDSRPNPLARHLTETSADIEDQRNIGLESALESLFESFELVADR